MLKNMSKEELETMSYNDIAYMLIKEKGKMTTADLFKAIVELLGMPKSTYEKKIGNFYTSITKDQRFLLLEDSNWDLKENHKVADLIDKEDLEDVEDVEEYEEEEEQVEDFIDETSTDDEDINDELKDLVILTEDELEQEE